ncbi:lipoprotein [Spiroplasma alleghenense]|uniref:Lipoprotein n=1 Tax=Spiroplasma alleghenense TaxID=216931 RepID=A0A345Z561_9MOLU|nr:lipoprotein [Spiroplasma alleghenense]AXK51740.1 hypothetical protein SALLE_v1c10700 [Spiroplasma alleghenense]
MKKLLSILASTSLIVSAPLAVISCKDTGKKNEFDYDQVLNEFISEVSTIFQSQVSKAFKKYSMLDEKDLEEETGYTVKLLKENKDDLKRPQSKFYKDTAELVMTIIPVDLINEELRLTVSQNLNYNPVLVDKNTPLKNGIQITKFDLIEKGDNVTLLSTVSADVVYKEKNNEKSVRTISSVQQINIFGKEDIAVTAKAIEEKYSLALNDKLANSMIFESDKGNLDNTARTISQSTEVILDLKQKITDELAGQTSALIVTDKLALEINDKLFVDSSRFETKTVFDENEDTAARQALMSALRRETPTAVDDFLKGIRGNGSAWIQHVIPDDSYSEEMKKAIESDPTISEAINQYNLKSNFIQNRQLQTILKVQNSNFALDMKKDKLTIALLGFKVKGVQFSLDGYNFDFPDNTIVYRQQTTFENTLSLYDEFMKDAFLTQSSFVGLENTSLISNPFEVHQLEWPVSWTKTNTVDMELFLEGSRTDELIRANYRAVANAQPLDLTTVFRSNTTRKCENYMYVNENGYLITYEGVKAKTNESALRTYFFSSGASNWNKVSFTFNKRSSRNTFSVPDLSGNQRKQFFADKQSSWKFKRVG